MPDEDGELFYDVVQRRVRRRRGKRKHPSRGPYSLAEKNMIQAWRELLIAERRMDGEIAEYTCRDLTTLFVQLRKVCEEYSYANCPDPLVDGVDPHVVLNVLDIPVCDVEEGDTDIYDALKLPNSDHARIRAGETNAIRRPRFFRLNAHTNFSISRFPNAHTATPLVLYRRRT